MSRLEVIEALKAHVSEGPIRSHSGSAPMTYVDARPVTFSMQESCAAVMLPTVELLDLSEVTLVVGPGYGCAPLMLAIARRLGVPACLVRDRPTDHGERSHFSGVKPHHYDKVVIIDDVLTSGAPIVRAAALCRMNDAEVLGAVALVSRCEGVTSIPSEHLANPPMLVAAAIQFDELVKL